MVIGKKEVYVTVMEVCVDTAESVNADGASPSKILLVRIFLFFRKVILTYNADSSVICKIVELV